MTRHPSSRWGRQISVQSNAFAAVSIVDPGDAGCLITRNHRKNSLDVKDGVLRVHSSLILCGLTNQTLLIAERDERWGCEVTLLVGNDLDIGTLIVGNAGVGCAWNQ